MRAHGAVCCVCRQADRLCTADWADERARVRACVRAWACAVPSHSRRVLVQPLVGCQKQSAKPAQGAKRRRCAGEVCCGARRGVSGYAACSGGARGAWLVRAARDGHGAPAQGRRTWHSSEMALRVFACARGRTRSFHAVCVEKGMRGAGRAWLGVWECWGARRRVGRCPKGDHFRGAEGTVVHSFLRP